MTVPTPEEDVSEEPMSPTCEDLDISFAGFDGEVSGRSAVLDVSPRTYRRCPYDPFGGGWHEYAQQRTADGRPVCIHCGYVREARL